MELEYEDGSFMNEITIPYKRDSRELSLSFNMWNTTRKWLSLNQKVGPHQTLKQPVLNCRKFLSFIGSPIYVILVIATQMD